MVQDSITDHIDTAGNKSSHLNFTYRMTIILAEIVPWYVTYQGLNYEIYQPLSPKTIKL